MTFDLSNHFPLGPAEGFEEEGYVFKAWQPANSRARRVIVVQAFQGDVLVREVQVQMRHPNIFGVDVEDMMVTEEATDRLLGHLLNE